MKYFAPPSSANISSMTGSGNELDFVTFLSCQKSYKNDMYCLSFSQVHGKLQGKLDLSINFASNISSKALSKIFILFRGILYGHNLMGFASPVSVENRSVQV